MLANHQSSVAFLEGLVNNCIWQGILFLKGCSMQIAQLEFQLDNSILTQRKLRLRIGAQDVSIAINQAATKLKPDVAAPGYRKGKAPLALIRKHHAKRVKRCIRGTAQACH